MNKGKNQEIINQTCLIYDAECRLCVVSKGLLERWDRKRFVRFVPCPTGLQSIWFADGKGGMVSGVPAFRALLPFLPMGKILALFFLLPGMNRLAVCIYRIIAKNRYRWFGAAEKE